MGGFGSGRSGGKPCTSERYRLDIRTMRREGQLQPWCTVGLHWTNAGRIVASVQIAVEPDRAKLRYQRRDRGGEWRAVEDLVRIERTPCHLGGERVWWRCPSPGCDRRVALLYLSAGHWACRQCCKLAYKSQRETEGDRAVRRANKLRTRLDWSPGILNFEEGKPKGMHWRTYWRLRARYQIALSQALAGIGRRIGSINSSLGKLT